MTDAKDLLGNPATECERLALAVHDQLRALLRRTDLAPCVRANARFALAATWQIVTDLGLRLEQDDDVGI
jgi:hypothetical protein